MIHYHGTPITPRSELQRLAGRCFCVPFTDPRDVETCHRIGQSVMLDNGAYSAWKRSTTIDWVLYYKWAEPWLDYHTTWAVIPDVVDGDEDQNDALLEQWPYGVRGAPVWHLHESLDRLRRLCDRWPRVCFGSSGDYAVVNNPQWHRRVSEAFDAIAPTGRVPVWIHMMRGLALSGSHYPFASADSTNVAQNHGLVGDPNAIAAFVDPRQCPARWCGATQLHMEGACTD